MMIEGRYMHGCNYLKKNNFICFNESKIWHNNQYCKVVFQNLFDKLAATDSGRVKWKHKEKWENCLTSNEIKLVFSP